MTSGSRIQQDRLSIELIRRTLSSELVGHRMCLLWDVSSTNDVLSRMAAAGAPAGTVVLAESQHAGRGRDGKIWFSPLGVNLYASVLLRPPIRIEAVPVFSFIASLALSDAIRVEVQPAGIKWPNDILVSGRKVAGTLVECGAPGGAVQYVIFGVGVNLNVEQQALEEAIGPGAIAAGSLRHLAGHAIDRNAFAGTVLTCLDRWSRVYATDGPEAVLAGWRERDALAGHRIEVRNSHRPLAGLARGVTREGFLLVEDAAGQMHRICSGEIRMAD